MLQSWLQESAMGPVGLRRCLHVCFEAMFVTSFLDATVQQNGDADLSWHKFLLLKPFFRLYLARLRCEKSFTNSIHDTVTYDQVLVLSTSTVDLG